MTSDAASRVIDRAEARERGKARRALAAWLRIRTAQRALARPGEDVSAAPDIAAAEGLLRDWTRMADASAEAAS